MASTTKRFYIFISIPVIFLCAIVMLHDNRDWNLHLPIIWRFTRDVWCSLVLNNAMLWFSLHLYSSQALLSAIHQLTFVQMSKFPNIFCNMPQLWQDAQFEAHFSIKSETNSYIICLGCHYLGLIAGRSLQTRSTSFCSRPWYQLWRTLLNKNWN